MPRPPPNCIRQRLGQGFPPRPLPRPGLVLRMRAAIAWDGRVTFDFHSNLGLRGNPQEGNLILFLFIQGAKLVEIPATFFRTGPESITIIFCFPPPLVCFRT